MSRGPQHIVEAVVSISATKRLLTSAAKFSSLKWTIDVAFLLKGEKEASVMK